MIFFYFWLLFCFVFAFFFLIIQSQAAFVNCLYVARFTIVHSKTQIKFPLLSFTRGSSIRLWLRTFSAIWEGVRLPKVVARGGSTVYTCRFLCNGLKSIACSLRPCDAGVILTQLVRSEKQRQDPCSGLPTNSTNYRKSVSNFFSSWLVNRQWHL